MLKLKTKWDSIPLTVKVSVAYAVCSILQRCLTFITLPLFTRLLTTEQYGQYTIYSSWSGIISIFTTLNLAYGSFQTAMVKYEADRDGYISSVQGIFIVLSAAFCLIYLPFRNLWNLLFELPTFFVLLLVIEIICQNTFLLWCGKKRFEFKYKTVVGLTLLISMLSPIVAYLLVINTAEKGYARILGYSSVSIVVGIILFVVGAVRGRKLYNKEYWKYAFGFNIPLLAYYLSQFIFNQSDRIMISHMVGTDKAGIYGVAYNLAIVLIFVLNAINNSYVPWYYGKIKEGRMEENRTVANGIAVLMMLLLSCVIWFAPEIVEIMAGEMYIEAVYVIAPVALSLLPHFYTQLFVNVEFYYEEKKKLVGASLLAALVNIALNFIFIQEFGFVAAAYTTLFSFIIFCYSNYLAMKKVLIERNVEDVAYDYKALVSIFIIFVLLTIIGVVLYSYLWARIVIAGIIFIGIVIKRDYFFWLYKEIKAYSQKRR